MGKKSPPPPDYTGAANAQASASKEITNQQTWANRPELSTPWGTQTWDTQAVTDPATGQQVTKWTSNIALSPQEQAALDSQMAIQQGRSEAAQGLLGQATDAFSQPMDWNNLPALQQYQQQQMQNTAGDWRQQAQDAVLDFQRPLQQERQASLESQLANMGLARGTEAWNREMRNLQDQNARDQLQAFGEGRQEANMLFGQDMAQSQFNSQEALRGFNFGNTARQQAISEGNMQRGQRLNELNALLTGQQVSMPQMPTFNTAQASQTPNLLGAAQAQYGAALNSTNASNMAFGNTLGGLASLGGAAMDAGGWGGLFSFG